jgi:outer membrane protein assembly factor BamB
MAQPSQEQSSSASNGFRAVPTWAWLAIGVVALIVAAVLILVLSNSSSGDDAEFKGDAYPGVEVSNTRAVKGPIDSSSASKLKLAWSLPLTAKSTYGAYSATPVITHGIIYSQDLASNVQAIDLANGEVQWTKSYEQPDQGPNGVVVAGGSVFGATPTSAFALDQSSGEEIWSTTLTSGPNVAIDMAPGYHEGLVYVSTVPTELNSQYPPGGVGVLWALDAETGKKVWSFNTVPPSLWGNPQVNSGGGVWYPPSFDDKGFMYFGTGNPAPFPGSEEFPFGESRPGPNLYTNSMVKLDAKTGKMQWYYQQTPHDLYDWDFQNSPILTEAGGRELAIGSGKSGIVVALDAETGKPVWKRPVGAHSGHDEDGLLAMRGETQKIKTETNIFPGTLGGVIAPMAADETTVYAPIVNHPAVLSGGGELGEAGIVAGGLAAVDIKTGAIRWERKFGTAAFGSPTVVNDMVFLPTFGGTVYGFDAATGNEVWSGSLPAGSNSGLAISGDTVIVPAGIPAAEGQKAEMAAFRLGG